MFQPRRWTTIVTVAVWKCVEVHCELPETGCCCIRPPLLLLMVVPPQLPPPQPCLLSGGSSTAGVWRPGHCGPAHRACPGQAGQRPSWGHSGVRPGPGSSVGGSVLMSACLQLLLNRWAKPPMIGITIMPFRSCHDEHVGMLHLPLPVT